ncbi:transcription antiterminator [Gemella sp. 19428wG2_WT2a]|nr:transcription antiterminator [Gemella sp. 19428wG2_WT2a]TFU60102.1 transcription antiterminator [Gemella sp. WT2a]
MTISSKLNQSRRKIYYHLEKINEALPQGVGEIKSYPRVGLQLTDEQKDVCRKLLAELDDYSYVMNVTERVRLSLIYIAISKERVTIEKLMHLTDVSRNTILSDLIVMRTKLSEEEYDIFLKVTKAKGYYLDCHPLSKIQYLYRLLYRVYTEDNIGFVNIVKDKIVDITGFDNYFSEEVKSFLKREIETSDYILGKKINHQDSKFMIQILPYLILSYRSIELTDKDKEMVRNDFEGISKKIEYKLAEKISQGLCSNFKIELDDIEISLIVMLLLSFRKYTDTHLNSKDYKEMKEILDVFLKNLNVQYGIKFKKYNDLLNQLLMHAKALIYRKRYGVFSINPLLKYIKEMHSELFEITKSSVGILEESWKVKLTDDDIAYITIHLGGELEKELVLSQDSKKAIIVCDEGIGVQKLLLNQVSKLLKNYEIEAVFTSEQYYTVSDLLEIDLIVTSNTGIESKVPIVKVHPVLVNEDIIKLVHISNNILDKDIIFHDELEKLLHPYIQNSVERNVLKGKIEKLVSRIILK